MLRKVLIILSIIFVTGVAQAGCPSGLEDKSAIQVAKRAMNTWFSAVQKGKLGQLEALFAPQFVILHSKGGPMNRQQQLNMLKGFRLGGYHFSNFCGVRINDTIVATFASKTYKEDISKSHLDFLSKKKAYRMVILKKYDDQWKIIAYANTNPVHVLKNSSRSRDQVAL